MTSPVISVILPTHAPDPARMDRTLEGLRRQQFPKDKWELVIVANASPKPLAPDLALAGHPAGRIVPEPRLGLAHARATGIAAARGEILVFVDDDNVLAPDYLGEAADLLARLPNVAAAGGIVEAEFAVTPPKWAQPYLGSLAIRDYGTAELVSAFSGKPREDYPYFTPIGAGLVIRRNAAERYQKHLATRGTRILGRTGRGLGSAEECEMIYRGVFLSGCEVAYSPRLRLTHLIPASRLKFAYLARLNYQGGASWSMFLYDCGLETRISSLSLPPRLARAFVRSRAWTRAGFIRWCSLAGMFVGRTRT